MMFLMRSCKKPCLFHPERVNETGERGMINGDEEKREKRESKWDKEE